QFDPEGGNTRAFAMNPTAGVGYAPLGLAVDGKGDLFAVTEFGNVEEFAADGSVVGNVSIKPLAEKGHGVFEDHDSGVAADTTSEDLYAPSEGLAVEHFRFTGQGEVLEPGGASCQVRPSPEPLHATGCPPTDAFGQGALAAGRGLAVD